MAISLAQAEKGTTGAAGVSAVLTFDSNFTNGNYLIVCLEENDDATGPSIAATGVVWTKINRFRGDASHDNITFWKGAIGAGASNTLTITASTNLNDYAVIGAEFSGVQQVVDGTPPTPTNVSSATPSVSSNAPSASGDLAVGFCGHHLNAVPTVTPPGWTVLAAQRAANASIEGAYLVLTDANAVTPQWTFAGSVFALLEVVLVLKAATVSTAVTASVRAFQEYQDPDAFQQLAFQRPDPARAFQEFRTQPEAFQQSAYQRPDWVQAFQETAFDDEGFQEAADAFQESADQGDAFQQDERPTLGGFTGAGQIASAEAFGSNDRVIRIVSEAGTGIASGEAFGTTKALRIVTELPGIASAEAFGTTQHVVRLVLRAGAIASAEAFGQPAAIRIVREQPGITSAEAFGTTRIGVAVRATAIGSAEAFGQTDKVNRILGTQGIASAEAFGTPRLLFIRSAGAIASAEAFGTTSVLRIVREQPGIVSGQAFGNATIQEVTGVRSAGGIASAEAFGSDSVIRLLKNVGGIASAQAFGTTSTLHTLWNVGSIASAEAFGSTPKLRRIVQPAGIASSEAFGTPRLLFLRLPGIASAEAFGTTTLAEVSFGSVFGSVAVSDRLRFELTISDQERMTVALADTPTCELTISDRASAGVEVGDLLIYSVGLAEKPGG